MGSLHLIRHGQTTSNVMARLDTRPPGAGLTDFGARQAVRFGLENPGVTPAGLYSSVARRARETAELIGSVWGVQAQIVDGVHEVQVGPAMEDRNDDRSVRAFRDLIADWFDGDTARRVGDSESLDDVLARYLPAVELLAERHLDGPDAAGDVYLVSHGAAIRLIAAHLGAVDRGFAHDNGLPNTASIELARVGDGWRCVHWGGVDPVRPTAAASVDPMG
ncbi:histidine phosphatase family protein [Williamsia deligens]|uniref:Histidine phosphatase family protein n=1 Tax=Williamsia deligens TaxID=321325 RepID=A0ABW3G5F0_9NOCA|nr:histidine phosphatase family protein [Williamsia deligens]MCP2193926.1 putative phosphoglycerate mutase [Williamsia deligens]